MPIELKMPALSPTMEEGTLAKWLVKEGDTVKSGDILAEIETDKATMEYEAVEEGTITSIVVAAGSEGVKVGAVIATLTEEGEEAEAPASTAKPAETAKAPPSPAVERAAKNGAVAAPPAAPQPSARSAEGGDRIKASPLARRLAAQKGIELAAVAGSGPAGRIVKADVEGSAAPAGKASSPAAEAKPAVEAEPASPARPAADAKPTPAAKPSPEAKPAPAAAPLDPFEIPHDAVKLSNMRKVIARRLTESKQQVPHIYLTVDIRLDPLLALRTQLNAALGSRGVKLSVNDLLIKALALALIEVPACNVSIAGDTLKKYSRADISVAVSIPAGLITPIVVDAGAKSVSVIATEMKALAERAKAGKLQPHEYQGGTASLSNMGMFGIKQFDAVINPPQGMILAVGAGERRPWVEGDALTVATVMSVTGSFDHRAIDGADGAQLMAALKRLVENPLAMLA